MNSMPRSTGVSVLLIAVLALTSGCAMFRAKTTDLDVAQPKHMRSSYDYTDMRNITQSVVDDMMGSKFLGEQEAAPIMMIAGVQNRTSRYVDTKALTDRIRTMLFQSGKAQFVNEARRDELLKEQGYQAAHATPATQVAIGRQLGAKYMMSGSLVEMEQTSPRQVRISEQQVNYYKLTVEITDLETGLLAWTTEKEFAREISKPRVGG